MYIGIITKKKKMIELNQFDTGTFTYFLVQLPVQGGRTSNPNNRSIKNVSII